MPTRTEPKLQPPVSPTDLAGEALSKSTVSLHWRDNSNNEDAFRIYRDGKAIATVGASRTNYEDTGLTMGKTYKYVVRAFNAAGESGLTFCTVKMPNPPMSVVLNYIGVRFDYDPSEFQGPGEIRLVVLISDGKQTIERILPLGEGSIPLNDYETAQLNQYVFDTTSVGDYLKVVIMVYDDDPETGVSDTMRIALPILATMFGIPELGAVNSLFTQYKEATGKDLFENKDDLVGYFEGYWSQNESWGMGQHNAVGTEDLRLWLSIQSEKPLPEIPKPVLLPDASVLDISLASKVEVGKEYAYAVSLRNNESRTLNFTLETESSVTGRLGSKQVSIPGNTTISEPQNNIKFTSAGVRTMTYRLLYNGKLVDSLSRTVEAKAPTPPPAPLPTPKPLSVTFVGWYVASLKVDSTSKNNTIVGRIHLEGGSPGTYQMRIRRDIVWADNDTVASLQFDYNGAQTTVQISFKPPYATGENSTDGYHIELVKNGAIVWTLSDAYPPRLRATR